MAVPTLCRTAAAMAPLPLSESGVPLSGGTAGLRSLTIHHRRPASDRGSSRRMKRRSARGENPVGQENMQRAQIKSRLARNTLWMSMGHGLRILVQAVYFTLIARALGVRDYGSFVGVAALVGILYPFGAMGSGHLLIKSVARDKGMFSVAWGNALVTTGIGGAALVAAVILLSRTVLPSTISVHLVVVVAIADIQGLSFIAIAVQTFQSFEQLQWTSAINLLISVNRMLGALLLIAFHHHPTALQWGYA